MKRWIWIVPFVASLTSCDPKEKVNAPGLREEVENRKIKRITEAEIQQRALVMGDSFALIAEKTLGHALKTVITEQGVSQAIDYCHINAYPLLSGLQTDNGIEIRRVSFKNRNPENVPDDIEKQLLEAFQYSAEHNIDVSSSVQQHNEDYYYVKPIYTKGLCLNCHGNPNEQIASENVEKLNMVYPDDKATGYSIDEFRGMWSIKIPKKQIVLAISDDTWKPKYEKQKQKR